MFSEVKFLNSNFSIFFPRSINIRKRVFDFEDKLKGLYLQPVTIPIADELTPEMPRIIFNSMKGSQISISQISLSLNIPYVGEEQLNIAKGKEYLTETVHLLFELLQLAGVNAPLFCGLTTHANLPSNLDNGLILEHLKKLFTNIVSFNSDVQLKTSAIVSNIFFSNIVIQNYRSWNIQTSENPFSRLSMRDASERGIQIIGDFNDRYAFNERSDYFSSINCAQEVINLGIEEVNKAIILVRGL